MTFRSTLVQQGGKALLVTGDLTIKGVTKPVTLDVEYFGTDTDPWGGTRVGFEGTTQISRREWGVDFNIPMDGGRVLVGDKIDITVAVQAVPSRSSDRRGGSLTRPALREGPPGHAPGGPCAGWDSLDPRAHAPSIRHDGGHDDTHV